MIENYDSVDVCVSVEVGKSEHHAVALNQAGTVLFDKALPNNEGNMRAVLQKLKQLATIGALPIAVAQAEGASTDARRLESGTSQGRRRLRERPSMNRLVDHVARFERGRHVQARDADGGPHICFGQPARGNALDDGLQRKLHHQRLGRHPRHPAMYPRPVLYLCVGVQSPTVLVTMHHDSLHKLIELPLSLYSTNLGLHASHCRSDVAAGKQVDPAHPLYGYFDSPGVHDVFHGHRREPDSRP